MGALPVPKINGNKGGAHEKNFFESEIARLECRWKYGGDTGLTR
jgi:hypothetical protein